MPQPPHEMPHAGSFRLVVVPGVTVGKWARTWAQRVPGVELEVLAVDAVEAVAQVAGEAGAGMLRLPVDSAVFHAIPLYTETTVVVVPRDHLLAAATELTLAELAGKPLLQPLDDVLDWPAAPRAEDAEPLSDGPAQTAARAAPPTVAAAIEMVAAGAGVLVVPESLARLHHRRDLAYRPVTDAPSSSVGLVWRRDSHTDLVERMIGIVRGRTVNSTRGTAPPPETRPRDRTKATTRQKRALPHRRGR